MDIFFFKSLGTWQGSIKDRVFAVVFECAPCHRSHVKEANDFGTKVIARFICRVCKLTDVGKLMADLSINSLFLFIYLPFRFQSHLQLRWHHRQFSRFTCLKYEGHVYCVF